MAIRALVLIILGAITLPASADKGGSNCLGRNTASKSYREMIQHVKTIGPDDRGYITAKASEVELRDEEVKRIRATTGKIICADRSGGTWTGSAFLAGSNGQIVANAHALLDPSGRKMVRCYFENQESPPQRSDLDLRPGNFRIGAVQPFTRDYAVVRLRSPIAGAQPFPLDTSGQPPQPGDEIIAVSGFQNNMPTHNVNNEPIVQRCLVRHTPQSGSGEISFYGDCDLHAGGSGSANLIRDPKTNQLVIRGLFVGEGRDGKDGAPYQPNVNYSHSISIGNNILDAVAALETGSSRREAQRRPRNPTVSN